jgi:hypothetical protein
VFVVLTVLLSDRQSRVFLAAMGDLFNETRSGVYTGRKDIRSADTVLRSAHAYLAACHNGEHVKVFCGI